MIIVLVRPPLNHLSDFYHPRELRRVSLTALTISSQFWTLLMFLWTDRCPSVSAMSTSSPEPHHRACGNLLCFSLQSPPLDILGELHLTSAGATFLLEHRSPIAVWCLRDRTLMILKLPLFYDTEYPLTLYSRTFHYSLRPEWRS